MARTCGFRATSWIMNTRSSRTARRSPRFPSDGFASETPMVSKSLRARTTSCSWPLPQCLTTWLTRPDSRFGLPVASGLIDDGAAADRVQCRPAGPPVAVRGLPAGLTVVVVGCAAASVGRHEHARKRQVRRGIVGLSAAVADKFGRLPPRHPAMFMDAERILVPAFCRKSPHAIILSPRAEHVSGAMVAADSLGEDDVAAGVVGPHGNDILVGSRVVPGISQGAVSELDDDQVAGPGALHHLDPAAMHQEPATERCQRGV